MQVILGEMGCSGGEEGSKGRVQCGEAGGLGFYRCLIRGGRGEGGGAAAGWGCLRCDVSVEKLCRVGVDRLDVFVLAELMFAVQGWDVGDVGDGGLKLVVEFGKGVLRCDGEIVTGVGERFEHWLY